MNKVKLTQDVVAAIKFTVNAGFDVDCILDAHKRNPRGWSLEENEALNSVDYDTLYKALKYGFEVDEQSSSSFPETTDYNMKAFYGMPIRILRGQFKGFVLPITFIRSDAKVFEIGNEHFFRTCDIGDWWQFADEKPKAKVDRPATREELEAELDYQLASLHQAIEQDDSKEIARCKQRLAELHTELGLAGEKHAI